ncbi:MAG: alpha/beta hydrolase [Clostridiales bacterium]|nr:alpha/beta hydrolase [Clostridiales bacterium]
MIDKWPVTVPGMPGKRKRNVYVYVPDFYEEGMRFPVLYMFDGHNVFFDTDATYGKCWGMKEYMEETSTAMIVVAVECNHGKNFARLKEYAPFTFEDEHFGKIPGKGKKYMEWMTQVLMPLINEKYPTLTGRAHTWIAGSSMGGLMSLYAAVEYNHVFSRAACLSPSLWTQPDKMLRLIRKKKMEEDTVIYLDYGSREMGNHQAMRECFSTCVKTLMDKGVYTASRIVPNGDHCESCWEEQIPFFMNTLSYQRD